MKRRHAMGCLWAKKKQGSSPPSHPKTLQGERSLMLINWGGKDNRETGTFHDGNAEKPEILFFNIKYWFVLIPKSHRMLYPTEAV
jgi:hypothetical protein